MTMKPEWVPPECPVCGALMGHAEDCGQRARAELVQLRRRIQDERQPKQCPRCHHYCVYDGWDHVHGTGIGIGSCG